MTVYEHTIADFQMLKDELNEDMIQQVQAIVEGKMDARSHDYCIYLVTFAISYKCKLKGFQEGETHPSTTTHIVGYLMLLAPVRSNSLGRWNIFI